MLSLPDYSTDALETPSMLHISWTGKLVFSASMRR